jgi:hypothetical protein
VSGAGPALARGLKGWPWPNKIRNPFSFINEFFRFFQFDSNLNLKMKKGFSQFLPKIKVVQNLILYNFHVGHFSKF